MSIALLRPNDARARPSSLLKRVEDYDRVFKKDYPIATYHVCAEVAKRIDRVIGADAAALDRKDQTNMRFYIAMDVACTALGKAAPTPAEIAAMQLTLVTDAFILAAKDRVLKQYQALGASDQAAKGTELIEKLKLDVQERFPQITQPHIPTA